MIETIRAERELLATFRNAARRQLGAEASDAEVEALATRRYEGLPPPEGQRESPEARRIREENTRLAEANYDRWLR